MRWFLKLAASSETAHTNAGSLKEQAQRLFFQELEPKTARGCAARDKIILLPGCSSTSYDAKLAGFSGAALPGPGPLTRALDHWSGMMWCGLPETMRCGRTSVSAQALPDVSMRGPAAAQTRVRTHLKRAVAVLGPLLFSSVHTALAAPHRNSRILGTAGGSAHWPSP
jgi:hypothetical protein